MSNRMSPKAYQEGYDQRWIDGSTAIKEGTMMEPTPCPHKEFTQEFYAWNAGYKAAGEAILALKYPGIAQALEKLTNKSSKP